MCLDFEQHVHRTPPLVYDDGKTKLYGKPDSAELIEAIARATRKAVVDEAMLCDALSDFGCDQAFRCDKKRALHACIDALIAGDDAQFGVLLARVLRQKAIQQAAENARDEYEDERS